MENYAIDKSFLTYLIFHNTGYYGSTIEFNCTSTINVIDESETLTYINMIIARDNNDDSVAVFPQAIMFKEKTTINVNLENLYYVKNNAKDTTVYVVFYSINEEGYQEDRIMQKRIQIPLHPFYFVSFDVNNTEMTTRFTSSFRYQKNAYIQFQYPECIIMPDQVKFKSCNLITWLTLENGFENIPYCSVEDNL